MAAAILFSLFCGIITDYSLSKHLTPRHYPITVLISVAASILLNLTFDDPTEIIKGFLFAQTLIIIGYCDAMTHEIPNLALIPIVITGLIRVQLIPALGGAFLVSVPFLLIAVLSKGGIGGGDVKLMAAAGFLLGPTGVIAATVTGFAVFLASLPFVSRSVKQKAYAMAPYLGIGCFLAYLFKL